MRPALKVAAVAAAAATALYLLPSPEEPPAPTAPGATTATPPEPAAPPPATPRPDPRLTSSEILTAPSTESSSDGPPALPASPATPQASATIPASRTSPEAAALEVAAAFARPPEPIDAQQWWTRLAPLLSPRVRSDYAGTNPAAVAFTLLTGAPTLVPTDAPRDLLTAVEVPTDAGIWRVELEHDATGYRATRIMAQDQQP